MDWQLGLVVLCVVLAAGYVVRAAWRTWHPAAGVCGGGCGCGTATPSSTLISEDQLTQKLRRPFRDASPKRPVGNASAKHR